MSALRSEGFVSASIGVISPVELSRLPYRTIIDEAWVAVGYGDAPQLSGTYAVYRERTGLRGRRSERPCNLWKSIEVHGEGIQRVGSDKVTVGLAHDESKWEISGIVNYTSLSMVGVSRVKLY